MKEIGPFDGGLHMFIEGPRSPDLRRLRFIRWLVEHNHFGHPAVGPASGELAPTIDEDIEPSPSPS